MKEPFYSKGLRFSCTACSACCRGGPGYVFLSKDDLKLLTERLKLDYSSFIRRYCTLVKTGVGYSVSLAEKKNYDCIFWLDGRCSIYEYRPVQCSTFPFWDSLLDSKENWEDAGNDCPGIGHGEIRSREYIEECLWKRRAVGIIILDPSVAENPESIDENSILGR